MLFKTHEANIPQIRAAVRAYDQVWVHGSGDIFPKFNAATAEKGDQDYSKIHFENYNKGREEMGYRVLITKANMPNNKTELDRLLLRSKEQEVLSSRKSEQNTKVKNLAVTDADYGNDKVAEDAVIDYSKYVKQ